MFKAHKGRFKLNNDEPKIEVITFEEDEDIDGFTREYCIIQFPKMAFEIYYKYLYKAEKPNKY